MATFTNQATLSYSGGSTNSNITTGELLETVSLTKTPVSAEYTPGGSVSYVVSIVNTGDCPVSGLTLTDDLGAYMDGDTTRYPLNYRENSLLYYVGGAPETAPAVTPGPPMVLDNLTIPGNSSVTLIYTADLTAYAPLEYGAFITNTATLTGAGLPAALSGQAVVTMEDAPALTISKSVSPDTVAGCGPLTYTFVIQNAGAVPADAGQALSVTDTFSPILSDLTAALDGQAMALTADYTYDSATGCFATVPGKITVPAATFTQNPDGSYAGTPGVAVLTVTGTL